MKRKKVSIIGSGPAGIFAAFKLCPYTDIEIFDKGREIEKIKFQIKNENPL